MDHFLTLFDMIVVLARRRYQEAERRFAALGLNHSEARLLNLLSEAGGSATQETLSNRLLVDRSNAGRALKQLEAGGYVERRKDETDKRANLVQMTPKGRDAVAETSRLRVEMARNFFGDMTEDEAGMVVKILNKAM